MKILVYGAGVLGSLYAARLKESGQHVSILARGRRLADIRQHGIELEDSASGQRTITSIDAVEAFAPADAYDLVVVLVRKNQVASVLPSLAANKSTPSFLFMINNAAGPDEYISAVGRERVLLGFAGAGGDNCQLAHDRSGVALMLSAIREGFRVLRVAGNPITPFSFQFLEWIPEILLVPCLQLVLNTTWAELVMTRHANAARDEMKQLADEFRTLAKTTSVPTPAIDCLYTYIC